MHWFSLYLDGFPETLQELRQCLENLSREVIEAFGEGKKEKNRESPPVVGSISSSKVIEKVLEFDTANNRSPLFVYSDATPYVNDSGNVCLYQISSKR